MSITRALRFTRRAWAQLPIPGYPGGTWVGGGNDVGDASGGSMNWQHIFSSPSAGLGDNNFYSIEQLSVSSTLAVAQGFMVRILNMDPDTAPDNGTNPHLAVPCSYAGDLIVAGSAVSTISLELNKINVKIWVGRFAGIFTDTGDMLVQTDNPGANENIRCKVQGYWWTPEAMNAPRGLIRPPDGIYGA